MGGAECRAGVVGCAQSPGDGEREPTRSTGCEARVLRARTVAGTSTDASGGLSAPLDPELLPSGWALEAAAAVGVPLDERVVGRVAAVATGSIAAGSGADLPFWADGARSEAKAAKEGTEAQLKLVARQAPPAFEHLGVWHPLGPYARTDGIGCASAGVGTDDACGTPCAAFWESGCTACTVRVCAAASQCGPAGMVSTETPDRQPLLTLVTNFAWAPLLLPL